MTRRTFAETLGDLENDLLGIRHARLAQIEAQIHDLAQTRIVLDDCKSMDTYCILEFAYSLPKRADDIICAMIPQITEDRIVPTTILARALLETIAMGCFFLHRMKKHVRDRNYPGVSADFVKFYAGSRRANTAVKGFHTNDALRYLDELDTKYFGTLIAKWPALAEPAGANLLSRFRETAGVLATYDFLSEISHPNGLGLQYLYPAADAPSTDRLRSAYHHHAGASVWQCHHLVRALEGIELFETDYLQAFPEPAGFQDSMKKAGM